MKDDTISRAAALNCVYGTSPNKIKGRIAELPSAQPVNIAKLQPNCNQVASDCISRQAALETMETWDKFGCDPDGKLVRYDDDKHYIPYVHYEDMVHAIKHMPSAQPGWIPTSERLPDVMQWVLCQCRAGIMDVLRLTADGSWNKNYPHTEYMSGFVVAWMPLPTSYIPEGDDKHEG